MRQLAWLHAAPRPARSSRPPARGAAVVPAPPRLSRMESMRNRGIQPVLPPVHVGAYLLRHLFEVGPTSAQGMGAGAVLWTEMAAWQAQTGIELQAWEARTLHQLSAAYAAALQKGEDPAEPAPWAEAPNADTRAAVARQIRMDMAAMRMAREHDQAHMNRRGLQ